MTIANQQQQRKIAHRANSPVVSLAQLRQAAEARKYQARIKRYHAQHQVAINA